MKGLTGASHKKPVSPPAKGPARAPQMTREKTAAPETPSPALFQATSAKECACCRQDSWRKVWESPTVGTAQRAEGTAARSADPMAPTRGDRERRGQRGPYTEKKEAAERGAAWRRDVRARGEKQPKLSGRVGDRAGQGDAEGFLSGPG